MERKIGIFEMDGMTIEYSLIGEGKPILVMHGGHSNCHEEFGYQSLYENGFSIITPTRAGYGRTSKEIGAELKLACYYYMKLLDELKVEKVHVLAMSAGGPSGIYFAAKYPDRVESLILQSAVTKEWLIPKDIEYKVGNIMFRPPVEKAAWKLISALNNRFPQWIFKKMISSFTTLSVDQAMLKINEGDIEEMRKMNNRQRSGRGFLIDLKNIDEISIRHLGMISCPVLIMYCQHDRLVPNEHAYHAQEHIPLSELYEADAWGHLIWLGKEADTVSRKVISFLQRSS
ncbi:alpha/beta hydrolase [Bacillus swezeyi]|uniref:Alpha/beta hydrolase n=1 Tax=Bacillus swezeyi TaxID=1925020 RepID=A0A1R1QTP6_9BACI|nr:alpha/beta hydrolase [Bacillus swezeyi]MEC1260968.1 alpha/beta hydrolase [Bacillus swezeyi]MED2928905.1 alpha/beta hydrolase [Bacillus swezeyi]MED2942943.1 alpha/beta hydrolase [Bacillus swezeyi]MED2964427.1 alpha/beta hydrolase [Bacillus swezeyi]MED3072415.1 alpha/beta hydrolase [Bacillus swezeyi]